MTRWQAARAAAVLLALAAPAGCGPAGSYGGTTDDQRWIAQCVRDNRFEGASASVVRRYCTCMNDKMPNSETRSISQWERSNPSAMRACERASGWR